MWEGRALGARRDIAALASSGLGVAELHVAAIELVDKVVPCELTCWASLDPDTATGDELMGLLCAAYGSTARERDICRAVVAGLSTSDIAARREISAHTVQDHLKSVFGKVGVRSRGELVSRLHP